MRAALAPLLILLAGACASAPLPPASCQGLVAERDETNVERGRVSSLVAAERDAGARAAIADGLNSVLADKLGARARVEDADELSVLARRSARRTLTLEVLAMTTGGQYGAYGSGFLTGWSDTQGQPRRPVFDIVTGASAGGLIAPLAFVGSEADPLLKLNVGIDDADVIRPRPLYGMLGGGSFYATDPLQRRVAATLTPELLQKIKAASGKRRLFLGATNVDAGRFEVFGIDAFVEKTGTGDTARACVTEALMATSAIPALFTPRRIDDATYLDAGVRQHVFLEGIETKIREFEADAPNVDVRVNVYIVVNGDLIRPAGPVAPGLLDITKRSFSLVIDEGLRQSLLRTIRIVERNGWTLRAVRAPVVQATGSGIFSSAVTRELYERGLSDGRAANIPWLSPRELRRIIED